MFVIFDPNHTEHSPSHEIYDGRQVNYAELPDRISSIVNALDANNIGTRISPELFVKSHTTSVHANDYVNFLRKTSDSINPDTTFFPSYYITDTYAPMTTGTYKAALGSVNIALTGAKMVASGEQLAYSLCRPPGHHAATRSMGGYCYLNNAAIAANYLSHHGRVAVLDIDYHHGNGTQEIFYERNDVLYVSLHAQPQSDYPYIAGYKNETGRGDGFGYNINYPLRQDTSRDEYIRALQVAIDDVNSFDPDYLVLSLGFDTYVGDPIAGFDLEIQDFRLIGALISELVYPTLLIQEGGYCVEDLGEIATNFLAGLTT